MKINHNHFLDLAFNQAEINLGKTKLNPSVGSILVENGSVISSGVTSINGRPHSETNTLNNNVKYKKASLYITLEPCTHHGLTPPCTDLIQKKNIKNVYYCFNDPDKRTYKKAKKILKKNKIQIKQLSYRKYKNFYKSYFINKKNNLPFISAKIAISKDFYTINKFSKWITNYHSRKIVHLIRSQYDCIISTSKSINKDNSLLNCRLNGMNRSKPDLFIIDLNFKLKKKLILTKLNKNRKTYIITSSTDIKKELLYKKLHFKIIRVKSLNTNTDFEILFKKLFKLGYGRILFETGLTFLNTLIKKKILNKIHFFQSNKKLCQKGLNNDTPIYLKRLSLKKRTNVNLFGDKLYEKEIK